MSTTRAKFKCDSVTLTESGKEVNLSPVTSGGPENENFFKWTPSGAINMGIVNPAVDFNPGQEYYVDFTPAPVEAEVVTENN